MALQASVRARACLRSMGIDLKKDVTIVSMGSDAIRYSAIKAGSVEAIMVLLPRNILLKKEGFNLFLCGAGASRELWVGWWRLSNVFAPNRRQAKAVLRGMLKTYRSLKVDRKDFVAFLVSRLKLERDVADETAAVVIEGQTGNGMIDETDLQAKSRRNAQMCRWITSSK